LLAVLALSARLVMVGMAIVVALDAWDRWVVVTPEGQQALTQSVLQGRVALLEFKQQEDL